AYNVNDIGTGALSNFEWGGKFEWEWWGGAELASGDPNSGWPAYNSNFPGNSSLYLNLKYTTLDPAAGADWSHAVRLPKLPWVPVANLTDAADRWALKFEYCVPANWLGGSMFIKSSNGDYVFRYEPWQTGPNSTAAFTTKGTPNKWETMVVPLSAFRKTDATLGIGRGTPAATVADIVKSDVAGSTELRLYMTNLQSVAVTNFNAAFDNFRVVKL
ncbi:MAG TPA: glycan-binding surface protein, partial [Phnomibacter sp.]|nr:glycan-binding surface protein [Phnomibacter sp.]